MAVGLGGSAMRMAVVKPEPGRLASEQYQTCTIGQEVHHLDGEGFFDWIASNLQALPLEYSGHGGSEWDHTMRSRVVVPAKIRIFDSPSLGIYVQTLA